jgi:non-specific protein-tyrosine kinase
MKTSTRPTASTRRFPLAGGKNRTSRKADGLEMIRDLQKVWQGIALDLLSSEEYATPMVLGVTSAVNGEGKTTNSLGLATALAKETDEKVLLVECDLGSESISQHVGVTASPGVVDYIAKNCCLEDVPQATQVENLTFIARGLQGAPGGSQEPWVGQMLSKLRRGLPQMLNSLRERYPYIILDMPPLLTDPSTKEMLNSVDGAFLTVRADVTTIQDMERAVREVGDQKLRALLLVGGRRYMPGWLNQLLSE